MLQKAVKVLTAPHAINQHTPLLSLLTLMAFSMYVISISKFDQPAHTYAIMLYAVKFSLYVIQSFLNSTYNFGQRKILYYRQLLVSEKFFTTRWVPLVLPSPVVLGEKFFTIENYWLVRNFPCGLTVSAESRNSSDPSPVSLVACFSPCFSPKISALANPPLGFGPGETFPLCHFQIPTILAELEENLRQ